MAEYGCFMIGIGIDMQSIEEFSMSSSLREPGLCFTAAEISHGEKTVAGAASSLAGIFAAKEALFKAFPKKNLFYWDDIEICHNGCGRPMFRFYGEFAQWMESAGWHASLSISHSGGYAVAVAIIEHGNESISNNRNVVAGAPG